MIARRNFMGAMLAAFAAPAFVRSGVLMPVRPVVWVPPPRILTLASSVFMMPSDQLHVTHPDGMEETFTATKAMHGNRFEVVNGLLMVAA